MDAVWLQAVAIKDSLFANEWPLWAWAVNLGTARRAVVGLPVRAPRAAAPAPRSARSCGAPPRSWRCSSSHCRSWPPAGACRCSCRSRACSGWSTSSPRVVPASARWPTRPWLARLGPARAGRRACIALAVGRGAYMMLVEHPERAAVRDPPAGRSPWQDAMRWLARSRATRTCWPTPGHAWKYGTSVRVGGRARRLPRGGQGLGDCDLLARRRRARRRAHGAHRRLRRRSPPTTARALGERYDLDYLVTDGRPAAAAGVSQRAVPHLHAGAARCRLADVEPPA